MNTKVEAIPAGYHTLIPYITVKGADAAVAFYQKAFGAKEIGRISMAGGAIAHAELEIGDSRIMLAEENPQWGNKSPKTLGGTPVSLCIYVKDVDAVFKQALKEGANIVGDMDVKDQFYGDRSGTLTDPFGHLWTIATHIENVSFEEMQKRMDGMFAEQNAVS
jgi:PhnB protein